MSTEMPVTTRIKLCGNWSIDGVAEQLLFLKSFLSNVTSDVPRHLTEICVQDVESIDASGYQLLAIFFHSLKSIGHEPKLLNPSTSLREKLETLGFTPAFDSGRA